MYKPVEPIKVGDSFIAVVRNGPSAGKELGLFECTQDSTKTHKPLTDRVVSDGQIFLFNKFEIRKAE